MSFFGSDPFTDGTFEFNIPTEAYAPKIKIDRYKNVYAPVCGMMQTGTFKWNGNGLRFSPSENMSEGVTTLEERLNTFHDIPFGGGTSSGPITNVMISSVILGVLSPPAIFALGIISMGGLIYGVVTYPSRTQNIIHELKIELKEEQKKTYELERKLQWEKNMRRYENNMRQRKV